MYELGVGHSSGRTDGMPSSTILVLNLLDIDLRWRGLVIGASAVAEIITLGLTTLGRTAITWTPWHDR
mgnify:CR=1 FL=1